MQDPTYLAMHANQPDTDNKAIALNDLEDGVRLTIISDIEQDQRLNDFKKSFERSIDIENAAVAQRDSERKRKADHDTFNQFVQQTRLEESYLAESMG